MSGSLVAIALLAGVCAYVVGYAFVAPRSSFLRSVTGGAVLAACVLMALAGPSVIAGFAQASGTGTWPAGLGPDTYRTLWIALDVVGLLAGIRVWRMRLFSPNARLFSLDESPVSRAESEIPLADSLAGALDVLGREKVTQRDVARMAGVIRRVGSRYFHQLPEKQSELYALVARYVPPAVAADVTGLLLEGAGRR